jgi:hypothetical protein
MSIFNPEYNLLFIHVPRTAGTSMEYTDIIGGGGHERIVDFPDIGNGVFKFSFVRNPWDRFISAWYTQEISVGAGKKEFTDFVISECSDGLIPSRNVYAIHFMPACHFILDEHGKIGVDFVGRYESLQNDWRTVCEKVGVEIRLGHERWRRHKHYRYYYTSETWNIIGKLYQRDIAVFGYESEFEAWQ